MNKSDRLKCAFNFHEYERVHFPGKSPKRLCKHCKHQGKWQPLALSIDHFRSATEEELEEERKWFSKLERAND